MDVSQLLKGREEEDTLQNIRKEYLNSKRTLEELMTKQSPTKWMDQQQQQQQQPQQQRKRASLGGNDDALRRQIRESLREAGRNGHENEAVPAITTRQNEGKFMEMERRLVSQEAQMQWMRNEIHQINATNQSLQGRVMMLEEQLRYMMEQHVVGKVGTNALHSNGHYVERAQSAPSTSSTSEFLRGSMNDTEDTKVLLGWKQNGHGRGHGLMRNAGRRSFSNLDDSTTKLLNLSR